MSLIGILVSATPSNPVIITHDSRGRCSSPLFRLLSGHQENPHRRGETYVFGRRGRCPLTTRKEVVMGYYLSMGRPVGSSPLDAQVLHEAMRKPGTCFGYYDLSPPNRTLLGPRYTTSVYKLGDATSRTLLNVRVPRQEWQRDDDESVYGVVCGRADVIDGPYEEGDRLLPARVSIRVSWGMHPVEFGRLLQGLLEFAEPLGLVLLDGDEVVSWNNLALRCNELFQGATRIRGLLGFTTWHDGK